MKPSLILVGLGNPGKEYALTRHNAGFAALDVLASTCEPCEWMPKQKFLADCCDMTLHDVPVLLVKPTTYMNNSGNAVRKILDFYSLDPTEQIIVICDDIDLPVGESRFAMSGGAGSHNGLKSIVDQIGESFPRLRIGIRGSDAPGGSFQQAGQDLASYVLSRPGADDQQKIHDVLAEVQSLIHDHLRAMRGPTGTP